MDCQAEFILFEGSEKSARAFVLHTVFPRFVLEFDAAGPAELVIADLAPVALLSHARSAAIEFFERELNSFEEYRLVRPEN